MNYECLDVIEAGPLMRVTLNRPHALNALNPQMVEELQRLFSDLYAREDVDRKSVV